jgi:hypothetical protein
MLGAPNPTCSFHGLLKGETIQYIQTKYLKRMTYLPTMYHPSKNILTVDLFNLFLTVHLFLLNDVPDGAHEVEAH